MNDATHKLIIQFIQQDTNPNRDQVNELHKAMNADASIVNVVAVYRRVLIERETYQAMPEQEVE